MDLSTDAVPTPSSNSKKVIEKNEEKIEKVDTKPIKCIYPVCDNLTNDDFLCLKMLCGPWLLPTKNFKIKRSEIVSSMILFTSLQNRFKNDSVFNFVLIELLFTIKRYDLLKKLEVCKHNAGNYIKNQIDPIWKESFKLIDQFNPVGKSNDLFKNNLVALVQNEDKPRLELLFESMSDLVEHSILDDIRIRINDLTDKPYPMDLNPCGVCVIINNKIFDHPKKFVNRDGTEVDREALKDLFTEFCFEVRVENNLTSVEIKKLMNDLADENHENHQCVVVCILSHGEEGSVIGTDGQPVNINKEIVSAFNSKSSLAGKPKLFFIQACQGSSKMPAVSEPVESGEPSLPPPPPPKTYNFNMSPDSGNDLSSDSFESHPAKSDYLICLSTVEGYMAYRNVSSGTWFIMTLVRLLKLYGCRDGIMDVMTRVNSEVAAAEGKVDGIKVKQQPEQKSTLRRRLIFRRRV